MTEIDSGCGTLFTHKRFTIGGLSTDKIYNQESSRLLARSRVQMTNRIPSIALQNIYNIFTRNRFYHRPELFVHIECQPEMSLMKVLATTTQICHNFIYFIPRHRLCRHKKAILRNNQLCTMP